MIIFKTFVIQSPLGLQMRSAADLVQVLSQFKSRVTVWKDQSSVNGKSLIGLLTLAAGTGVPLKFVAEGDDADEVIDAIYRYFKMVSEGTPSSFHDHVVS